MKKLLMILSLALLASTQAHAVYDESAPAGITVWFTADEYWDLSQGGRNLDSMIEEGMTGGEVFNALYSDFPELSDVMHSYNNDSPLGTYVVVETHDELGGYQVRGPDYRWGFTLRLK